MRDSRHVEKTAYRPPTGTHRPAGGFGLGHRFDYPRCIERAKGVIMRETMGRAVPEDEGRLQANDAEIPGAKRDSAEALGGAGEPAGTTDAAAGEPHGRVSTGVLRTLFILNILEERTDAHQGITADDIKALLAAPPTPPPRRSR